MKKSVLFILCIIGLFASSCSNDSDFDQGATAPVVAKNHFYGVKRTDAPTSRAVGQKQNYWFNGTPITVKFLNDPYNAEAKIKEYAKEWEKYANITFKFVDQTEDALVRIGFDWNDNRTITWSYIGTDCKMVTNQNEATMSFAFWDWATNDEQKGDVLRAFGQVLGLEFEHRHLDSNINWTNYVQNYWEGEIADIPWEDLKKYVFDPLKEENVVQTESYDEESIMIWPFPRKVGSNVARNANYELSSMDKEFIAQIYPGANKATGTIQELWVDPGFFVWVNSGELKMTELGLKQEYLPDVTDGEQLTTGASLFYGARFEKAPYFNSSNITDFSNMFAFCSLLVSIPELDMSNGADFNNMFIYCFSLKSIPKLNMQKGINFNNMFAYCQALTNIPELNTSNGKDFSCMFYSCNLTSIPKLDTSNGTDFSNMFSSCGFLTSIPELDTSNGNNFSNMLSGCPLTSIPQLNTSKGTDFSGMFGACISLTSIPELDTSNGNNFSGMFSQCDLTSIPKLNTSNGNNFSYMFYGCSSLSIVPQFNTSNGIDFSNMFYGCGSLTSIPQLNTSKGSNFEYMFQECTSLINIPLLNTSSGSNFSSMFGYCTALTGIPLLNTSIGNNFSHMFIGCTSLTNVPQLDTSNGYYFYYMFKDCTSLKAKPILADKAKNDTSVFEGTKWENDYTMN